MTTYICKCGKTFGKNTGAGTTGNRMPWYGPYHECYGCPFIQKERWRENNRDVDAYACRGSKVLDYQTDAYCCDSKGAALHVRTLDLEFIQKFFQDYIALPGHTYDHLYHGMDSPENGRRQYSFGFAANKQGAADRETLIDRYFRSEGERPGALPSGADRLVRKDVTPEKEKKIVLNQIKEAKALAQGVKGTESVPATKYTDGRFIYFIAPGEAGDGQFITWYRDSTDPLSDPKAFRVVVSGSTFEDAQEALDLYARQNGNLKPCSGTVEAVETEQLSLDDIPSGDLETEQPDDDPDDLGPDGMEELAEYQELTRPNAGSADDAPKSDENDADPADEADETPDSGDETSDSTDDGADQPCDWKNASGGDEDAYEEGTADPLPDGQDLSLRLPVFNSAFDTADNSLRNLARAMKTKLIESGELVIKIVLNNYNGVLKPDPKKCSVSCNPKPAKISTPIQFPSGLEIGITKGGEVIVSDTDEDQTKISGVFPKPGGTATVDGKTGIVEKYQEDDAEEDPPAAEDDQPESDESDPDPEDDEKPEQQLPCDHDCPFFGVDGIGNSTCCFDDEDPESPNYAGDVWEAVHMHDCQRQEVLDAYRQNDPVEDYDGADGTDGPIAPENNEEDFAL